jgi:formylglycine-generating enzyme required for sulfatase activity
MEQQTFTKTFTTTVVVKRDSNSLNIKKRLQRIVLIGLFAVTSNNLFANHVVVSNVALTGQNTVLHFTLVRFDISWDNSWRTSVGPSNWDAAWVFVKYRKKTQTTWKHATLNWVDGTGSGDGHTEPANSDINSSNDNGAGGSYGVFIHRDADMVQDSVSYTGVQLRWNYGVDGLIDADSVEVCVFAIEMVYVPQGSFYVGSGGGESGAFYTYPTTTNAYQITSEGAITVGTAAGNLYYPNTSALSGDQTGPIPAAFPKGYNAFYCMKYEITQAQYVAFLNKLDNIQAPARAYTAGGYRNGITGTPGNYTTTNPYVACNYLSWADLAAYLDWAALRPMTELEYEKAARGTLTPVPNEYAWGSASIITQATGISNAGLTNETASNAGANCAYNNAAGVQAPMRVGNFAQTASTRTNAGASYYGIMDLSGNLWERPVTVGNAAGRAFTGVNGNGVLTSSGDADASNWPNNTTATGAGGRGGDWRDDATYLRVSDRYNAAYTFSFRSNSYGGRGVRVAP